jgi:transcriptional regulator with XRE-family HTH domain
MKVERKLIVEIPDLRERIKEARLRDGLPVRVLASAAGMTQDNWFKLESGVIKTVPEETLRRVEKALNINFGVTFDD